MTLTSKERDNFQKVLQERSSKKAGKLSVLFVCLGNICRSPAAEAICRKLFVDRQKESDPFNFDLEFDSAGTSGYHMGDPADERSMSSCLEAGYKITSQSRKIYPDHDFAYFDLIIAMDNTNYENIQGLATGLELDGRLWPLVRFSEISLKYDHVPDPYFGGEDGFAEVITICENACRGLLNEIHKSFKPDQ